MPRGYTKEACGWENKRRRYRRDWEIGMDLIGDATSATSILKMFSSAYAVAKEAKELVKGVRDEKIKDKVDAAVDSLFDLREKLIDYVERMRLLAEENDQLKKELARRAEFEGPFPPYGYMYRLDGPDHAICGTCYQTRNGLVSYMTPGEMIEERRRRFCPSCKAIVYEEHGVPTAHRITSRSREPHTPPR
jgi:hypothetical protein